MSNSTDDAVLDYFSLLLAEDITEDNAQPETDITPNKQQGRQDDKQVNEAIRVIVPEVKPVLQTAKVNQQANYATPKVNKKSLAQLLAPVAEASPTDIGAKLIANLETRIETKLTPQLKTELKTGLNTQLQVKITDKTVAEIAKPTSQVKEKIATSATLNLGRQEVVETEQSIAPQTQTGSSPPGITEALIDTLDEQFQVLFFNVAGLTLAVPLVSLGGIVKIERVNHIMGRPNWYHGVQAHRGSQLNVVDTCAWVMPEKYDDKLAQSVNYQYIVQLENSNWGLACESLINSVKILKSEVNWRTKAGKRPWLAGVVKEQMCGILHVQALIELLNLGLSSQDSID